MIELSIVIPSYNGCHKLRRTLDALNQQSILKFEVIVVVDGSTDDTLEYLHSFKYSFQNLIIIEQENRGRSLARNRGIAEVNSALILFLDDDIEAAKDVVEKHFHFHARSKDSVLVGTVFPNIQLFSGSFVQYLYQSYKSYISEVSRQKISHQNLYFTSAHFSISKDLFSATGGFNAALSDAEDIEFASRLINARVAINFDTGLVAYHNDNETLNKYIGRNRSYKIAQSFIKDPHINPDPSIVPKDTAFKKSVINFSSSLVAAEVLSVLPRKVRNRIYGFLINLLTTI